jgi:hypothetical protein
VLLSAVRSAAVDDLHVTGIVATLLLLVALESLGLLVGTPRRELECLKETFRAFSFEGTWWLRLDSQSLRRNG